MRLLLRQDAHPALGVGHLLRSLALAQEARSRGHEVVLCGTVTGGWAREQVAEAGLELLPTTADVRALAELAEAMGADVVHVDHYGRDAVTASVDVDPSLREALHDKGIRLSNLQDGEFGRRPADLVVDPTSWVGAQPPEGDGVAVTGPAYLPLRPSVLAARSRRRHRAGGLGDRLRVIVVMGGTDVGDVVGRVVQALVACDLPADVLAVASSPANAVLAEALSTRRVRVLATPVRSDLPRLLADHDLAVCAAGTTAWELCCIGTPMALVRVAENQRLAYDGLVAGGAAAPLGGPEDLPEAPARLQALMRDSLRRLDLAAAAGGLVDGGGAGRVLDLVEAVVSGAPRIWRLRARPATPADADQLLSWRNDDGTRRGSRQQEVVSPAAHLHWLDATLADPRRHLLVVDDGNEPVGTVRWDRLDSDPDADWEVSITVAPERRGLGVSGPMLAEAERLLHARGEVDSGLLARVHVDNATSARLFAAAGYQRQPGAPDELGFARLVRPARPSRR